MTLSSTSALARAAFAQDLAEELSRSFPLCILKGAALHRAHVLSPRVRTITDLDVLVPEGSFFKASTCLRDLGFSHELRGRHATTFAAPNALVTVDLHRSLFPPWLFCMPTGEVLANAQEVDGVRVPGKLDFLCHAVGHFIKSRHPATHPHAGDVAALVSYFGLSAAEIAHALQQRGLNRAALSFFTMVPSPLGRDVVAELEPSCLSQNLVRLAHRSRDKFGRSSPLAVHLLNQSLLRGGLSLSAHIRSRV